MRFEIIINKSANFYFFIQNLSKWHFSCREEHNLYWQNILNKFSKEEITALKNFKRIRLKYPASKSIFEQSFFLKKYPFKNLKSNLSKKGYESVYKTFLLFTNKFNIIYRQELIKLKSWKMVLNTKLNKNKFINKIDKILSVLYNVHPSQNKINIYLLISSKKNFGGGANINNKSITLEISQLPLNKYKKALGIIWHEIIHLLYEKRYFMPLIKKIHPKNDKKFSKILEIASYSLFPQGILGKKFFNTPLGNNKYFGRHGKKAKIYFNLMNKYVEQNKKLDERYIENLLIN